MLTLCTTDDHKHAQARLRSAPLRRLEGELSKISKRRALLEKDLRHVGLPLVNAALIDDMKLNRQKHEQSLHASTSGATAQAPNVLTEFPITSSIGTRAFLWPTSQGDESERNTGWGAGHGVDRYINKAQSHLLTGRFEQAEEELTKAQRTRGGSSALKQFRLGSSLALTTLALGKYAESAKLSKQQIGRMRAQQQRAADATVSSSDAQKKGQGLDAELDQMRRRRTGHAATDKEREERLKRHRRHERLRSAATHYNRGLALAAAGRHKQAIGSYTSALKLDGSNTGFLLSRAASYKTLGAYKQAILDLDLAAEDRLCASGNLEETVYEHTFDGASCVCVCVCVC